MMGGHPNEEIQMARRRSLEDALEAYASAKDRYALARKGADELFDDVLRAQNTVEEAAIIIYGKEDIVDRMFQYERDYESERFWERASNRPEPPAMRAKQSVSE